ncbi:50S ribosomal protein L28 [Candidatus Uhrbacteria bacterium RIFCSPLOWO2_01_FULL_47_24]|uniref:Large ribosomal subunit protein bL28 n=1 Tax=Candidatus Uhrbacteria bacterium RIFCSPLOWO2_01_FULL_47_24 TaxID=1802401 RepID=A0A1F7UTH1_9BACT|nr:MAG: 50S ribosomal protein L28 [Candidatus Uhrbacteria bacterium RIFCSPHIGHO2_01_FULL_47_11]OGL68787.1 MAG: 50S ribosomal protein L28 [Candidatus Uhrbacteria bacterium RIFCSPHIGHO2_02_FULL_46_47]OGL75249.1 MAG: 50S ribosomal protein L28 [Candidatus Uhrbacteria bacterium RIFCSPHIGHO2_12_FULL_47_11]OGL81592.1 MAG: 50S ribosomal protein L28 [Candidatus Uhrbacteria bacterium RIFCSPLOWO2_01_FULL_47_24]OGL83974.1 MAG: 50S ribosomal protein L28 [Candidatus Uhrbacteria bacterium RIFCSPLOWO2_02_FULL_
MSKTCEKCARGPQVGISRSHSMIKTKRKFNLNLQTRTIGGKRMNVCTNCIKTGKKTSK